jgi:hypothetical protein
MERMMRFKVRLGFIEGAAALALLICGFSGYKDTEIDLNTARIRTTRYIFFEIPVSRQVRSTQFSQLAEKYSLARFPSRWKLAVRTPYGLYGMSRTMRVDNRYCGAMSWVRMLGEILSELDDQPAVQRAMAAEVMGYLQSDDSETADRRANELSKEVLDKL